MKPYKQDGRWMGEVTIKGKRHRWSAGPTKYTSYADAKRILEEKTAAAWEETHEENRYAPTLRTFLTERFEPWARNEFEATRFKNWEWYRTGIRSLLQFEPMAGTRLSKISEELISEFKAFRLQQGVAVSTVNNDLRVLRSALNKAIAWKILKGDVEVKLLSGENHRERVLTVEEENCYLGAASEPLASIAALLVDTGMRPDEAFRLRWEQITWENGSLLIERGKTKAARRLVYFTPRVKAVLESIFKAQGSPEEGWVWRAETRSGHAEPSTIRKQHKNALRSSGVRPFVLYTLRHTFLTRIGTSGVDPWTFMKIAGHSTTDMGKRYVHPDGAGVLAALEKARQGFSHTEKSNVLDAAKKPPQNDWVQ